MIGRLIGRLTNRDIELESEDFNRAFTVSCPDRKFASDVLHPRMMEFLLQHRALAFRFDQDSCGDRRGRRTSGDRRPGWPAWTPSPTRCPSSCGASREGQAMTPGRTGVAARGRSSLLLAPRGHATTVSSASAPSSTSPGADRRRAVPAPRPDPQPGRDRAGVRRPRARGARGAGPRPASRPPRTHRAARSRARASRTPWAGAAATVLARAEAYPDLKASANFLHYKTSSPSPRTGSPRPGGSTTATCAPSTPGCAPSRPTWWPRVRLHRAGLLRAHRPGRRAHRLTDSSAVWPACFSAVALADESALASSHTGIGPLPKGGPDDQITHTSPDRCRGGHGGRRRRRPWWSCWTARPRRPTPAASRWSPPARRPRTRRFSGAPSGTTGVFFMTAESLSAGDGDAATDVYRNDAGTVSLVTPGTDRRRHLPGRLRRRQRRGHQHHAVA